MFSFSTEQKVFDIHGVPFGGQPGQHPTVLFGTIFYGKQFREFGSTRQERAEKLLAVNEEMGDLTGNPPVVDIFIDREEDIRRNIEFVMDHISDRRPFAVDIPEAGIRMSTLRYLADAGLLERTIYNSVNLGLIPEEFELLKKNTPAGAILLGYNPKDFSADGRVDILETGAGMIEKGIMDYADEAGIEGKLLDTGAVPFGHNAAETIRAVPVMKNKWGMPVGSSFHNTVESWSWLKKYRKNGLHGNGFEDDSEKKIAHDVYRLCDIASNGLVTLYGGSFVLYGPIENAQLAFPYVAMVDKIVSEGAEDYFGIVPAEGHPRLKLE